MQSSEIDNISWEQLLQLLKTDEVQNKLGLATFHSKWRDKGFAYLKNRFSDLEREELFEVVDEVLSKLLSETCLKIREEDLQKPVAGYFMVMLRNAAFDRMKRKKVLPQTSFNNLSVKGIRNLQGKYQEDDNSQDTIISLLKTLCSYVSNAMDRKIIYMKSEGVHSKEISNALGISPGNVDARYHRKIKKLPCSNKKRINGGYKVRTNKKSQAEKVKECLSFFEEYEIYFSD